MDLYLRKSDQGQLGPEIYRVILKDDGDEVEIGSRIRVLCITVSVGQM